jgi:hypothetical protein
MTKNEFNSLLNILSKLGIISENRNIKLINTGPFNIKYPVNNFSMTTEHLNNLVEKNPLYDKFNILNLILKDVLDKNETDYFALQEIYSVLAWAAFENNNKDHFLLNQKRIYANIMMQYDPIYAEENKDFIKTYIVVSPDNNPNCNKCSKLVGRNFEVKDFLDNLPIPVKGCTKVNGICIALGSILTALHF